MRLGHASEAMRSRITLAPAMAHAGLACTRRPPRSGFHSESGPEETALGRPLGRTLLFGKAQVPRSMED